MQHKVIDIEDVVIRFAGDSGDGMQLTGTLFADSSALFGNEISTFPDYPAEIRDIIKFLDDNLSKNLTVKQIAEKFSISQSKLKKLFHNYARRGVIQCFNDRKIVKAKRLIRENNLNFTEIADILAFNSVHYFSRLFKIKTSMTPSEYKNSIK